MMMMTTAEATPAGGLILQAGSRPRIPDVCHQLAEDAAEGNLPRGSEAGNTPLTEAHSPQSDDVQSLKLPPFLLHL